jgi:hypothetical protein
VKASRVLIVQREDLVKKLKKRRCLNLLFIMVLPLQNQKQEDPGGGDSGHWK